MLSQTEIIVRYQETDQMGVVHHSVYPVWFECGRTDLIKKAGITYDQMEKDGVMLPLLDLKCRFASPCFYGDTVIVKTGVKDIKPTRITFFYEVFRKGSVKPAASGETEHVWANRQLKPVNMKKYRPDLYQLLIDVFMQGENCDDE
ncbi:MAG TPA: 4-hydroxybenzoyl-CoA thioesterase [Ruminiclostridium sp.]|jgi:acyl-CoA thioester hydrolase|nr:acyl-CoA thioesterase [Clostridiaceae bacterium]HAA25851.1 4-hydroxybenzoyl-CoA thioesterase [Ruminiclostridium sp.]